MDFVHELLMAKVQWLSYTEDFDMFWGSHHHEHIKREKINKIETVTTNGFDHRVTSHKPANLVRI